MSTSNSLIELRTIDIGIVVIVNIINCLIVFVSRALGEQSLECSLGLVLVALTLPLLFAVVRNLVTGREGWTILLPSLMTAYLVLELVLDYLLKIEFRRAALLSGRISFSSILL